jgi:methylated-DNA-protein-cysteine methyltransferase-like protein
MAKTSNPKGGASGKAPATSQDVNSPGYRERVFEIVRQIPAAHVMTYGQIANILGEGYTPRTVGFVMHSADGESVPWQRVINSQGACSTGRIILPEHKQQRLLEAEGIEFDARGRCNLDRYRWSPPDAARGDEEDNEHPRLFDD